MTTCIRRVLSPPSRSSASWCQSSLGFSSACAWVGSRADIRAGRRPCVRRMSTCGPGGQCPRRTSPSTLQPTVSFVRIRTTRSRSRRSTRSIRTTCIRQTSRSRSTRRDGTTSTLTTWSRTIRSWRTGRPCPRPVYICLVVVIISRMSPERMRDCHLMMLVNWSCRYITESCMATELCPRSQSSLPRIDPSLLPMSTKFLPFMFVSIPMQAFDSFLTLPYLRGGRLH